MGVCQILWDTSGGRWTPNDYSWVDPVICAQMPIP